MGGAPTTKEAVTKKVRDNSELADQDRRLIVEWTADL
jgi:hypothetical protein